METRSANSNVHIINNNGVNVCRICLKSGGGPKARELESIFSTIGDYEEKSLYGIMVTICVPLRQREMLRGMPERICRGCKWRLLSAYELYETCLQSDERLRKIIETQQQQQDEVQTEKVQPDVHIKQEVADTVYGDNSLLDGTGISMETTFYESPYGPKGESTRIQENINIGGLLVEMEPVAPDPMDVLFEENYAVDEKGGHMCKICGLDFPYKSSCRTHILVKHDPAKPFKCDVCFYTLTTATRLNRHKAMSHGEMEGKAEENSTTEAVDVDEKEEGNDEESVHTCKICSKTFNSIVRFKKHRSVHVVYNRPYKCETCLYRFPTRAQLTQHEKVHREKPDAADQMEIQCDQCEEKFPGKRALTMHVRRFHNAGGDGREKGQYKCIICSEEFARESVLTTHLKMHELLAMEKEKAMRAEQLQLAAAIKKEQREIKSSKAPEPDVKPAVVLKECQGSPKLNNTGGKAASGGNTNDTKAKLPVDPDLIFVCMVCQLEFDERELLLKHQRKLHSELQLNIVSADESMDVDSSQQENDHSMGEDQSEQNTKSSAALPKCDLCQRTFQYNCLLQAHIKSSHSASKPFECKVCHMRFGYRATLQKHEFSHSAQKVRAGGHGSIMYKCRICEAKFLELKLLVFHVRNHRNESSGGGTSFSLGVSSNTPARKVEIFQCNFCPQIFSEKDELEKHLERVHQRQLIPPQTAASPIGPPPLTPAPAARKPPVERPMPKNEKELFFSSLSIVKVEHLSDGTTERATRIPVGTGI